MHNDKRAEDLPNVVPLHDLQCPIKMSQYGKFHGKFKYRLQNTAAVRLKAANMAKRFAGTSASLCCLYFVLRRLIYRHHA